MSTRCFWFYTDYCYLRKSQNAPSEWTDIWIKFTHDHIHWKNHSLEDAQFCAHCFKLTNAIHAAFLHAEYLQWNQCFLYSKQQILCFPMWTAHFMHLLMKQYGLQSSRPHFWPVFINLKVKDWWGHLAPAKRAWNSQHSFSNTSWFNQPVLLQNKISQRFQRWLP